VGAAPTTKTTSVLLGNILQSKKIATKAPSSQKNQILLAQSFRFSGSAFLGALGDLVANSLCLGYSTE
jgi:hypothetical protein